ncbi:hypothetical protein A966_04436 [Brachyspira hampsonii 30446]|uniref:Uncharacterized protein n=1 Tax=Brachyspira hampsonii 30446 TaxID=1289135 RepID=A0A2U4EWX3_9SPIR|nr:hypothetical protein [Brachyspira hampsonii]EKV57605.1 hypothetical protein A966_04436 [Brachyspira hampsonii 30446]OEJ20422.1 hypothetical protein A9495_12060 [Brachyspira hampsonii]
MIHTYGGFEIDVKQKNEISKELEYIFRNGTHLLGVRRELMLYLGKQVVHGINYAFVARSEVIIPNPRPYYELIIINVNEEGKTCIVRRETILKASASTIGGIICSKEDEAPIRIINSTEANNLLKLFDKGMHKVLGIDYEAELYLGHQTVKGMNYYYLAEAKSLEPETKSIKLVVINLFMDKVKVVQIKDVL